jgi:hypothetical protein
MEATTTIARRAVTHDMKLYELTAELEAVIDALIENGGELTPELEAELDALEGALAVKVERCALAIRQLEAQAESARVESRRLAELAGMRARASDRLKAYTQEHMERADVRKVEGALATVWVQKNGRPSIRWTRPEDDLPEAFRRVRIEPDTQAAYDEWRVGAELPEGFEVEHGSHLRIR